jgi:hypothetical protein
MDWLTPTQMSSITEAYEPIVAHLRKTRSRD